MPHTWFLVPGYGSQGGTAADVVPALDANGKLINEATARFLTTFTKSLAAWIELWKRAP